MANQIAAGEVVERPASVVKELAENALDAGATRVSVVVEDGGKKLIRVTDNGCGMTPEDAVLALERHATSKVWSSEDLRNIASLGFRGEALPSIRSVSDFRLRTRPHDAVEGSLVAGPPEEAPVAEPSGGPPGTEVSVADLFINVPARRKFLRRTGTEMSRISQLVDQLALGWPGVHFSLQHNGRKVSDYPTDRDLRSRILAVLGRDACRALYPVHLVLGEHRVTGYASEPGLTRPNAQRVFTYVNGRFVRDRVLQHAITRAYADVLDRGRHPIVILYLELPSEAVDVNVHPGKAEVRFVESGSVHGLIERCIRLMLSDMPWTSENPVRVPSEAPADMPLFGTAGTPAAPPPERRDYSMGYGAPEPLIPRDSPGSDSSSDPSFTAPMEPGTVAASAGTDGGVIPHGAGRFTGWVVMGRAHQFLLCAAFDALHVVHVGRARRRLIRHRLTEELVATGVVTQPLLFPAQITLSTAEATVAGQCGELLLRAGVGLEPFGGNDWVVTELPACAPGVGVEPLVRRLLGSARPDLEDAVGPLLDAVKPLLDIVADEAAQDQGSEPTARALLTALGGLPDDAMGGLIATRSFGEVGRWFSRE